jgi:dienelactone hydrolase
VGLRLYSHGERSKPGFLSRLTRVVASKRTSSWRLIGAAAGFAGLVFGIVLRNHLIPHLPPPAGPFSVGTVLWEIDPSAAGSSSSARGGCPLSVQLWYPAKPGSGDGRAPYRPSGAPSISLERWVRTSATLKAALPSDRVRYPVILSLPAWDGAPGYNTVFAQDLASRGFVVVALGYDNPACAGVDDSTGNPSATAIDFSSQVAFEQTVKVAHLKIQTVAEAASRVIDGLAALDRDDPVGRFRGRLDLGRIGVVGYSLGGAIAMQLCWRDDRLRAAVNIDGWMFDAAPGGWIDQPLLIISDDTPAPTSADLNSPDPWRHYPAVLNEADSRRISSQFAKHGGVYLVVLGSEHGDFNDTVFLRRRALLLGPKANGAALRNAAAYSAAFFEQVLNGETSPLFSNPPSDVRLQIWDRPPHEESARRSSEAGSVESAPRTLQSPKSSGGI